MGTPFPLRTPAGICVGHINGRLAYIPTDYITAFSPVRVPTSERQWARLLTATGQPFFHRHGPAAEKAAEEAAAAAARPPPGLIPTLGEPPAWPSPPAPMSAVGGVPPPPLARAQRPPISACLAREEPPGS